MNKKAIQAMRRQIALLEGRVADAKAKKIEEGRATNSIAYLIESAVDRAELVLAAKSITNRLQDMAEDMAKVEANDLMPMIDALKSNFGLDVAARFERAVSDQVRSLTEAIKGAKDTIGTEIMRLERAANGESSSDLDMLDAQDQEVAEPSIDDIAGDEMAELPADDIIGGDDADADLGDLDLDADLGDLDADLGDIASDDASAAGRSLKDSVQYDGVAALRESANPDRLVVRTFVAALREGQAAAAAAKMVAEHFGIDASDVADIVREYAQTKDMATRTVRYDDRTKASEVLDRFAARDGLVFEFGDGDVTIAGSENLLTRVEDELKIAMTESEDADEDADEDFMITIRTTGEKKPWHVEEFSGSRKDAENKLGDVWNAKAAHMGGRGNVARLSVKSTKKVVSKILD